jgi:HD superfamily phosphodiesterase
MISRGGDLSVAVSAAVTSSEPARAARRLLDPVEKVGTMVERMASRTESELSWAERTATELLTPLEARWRHTLRVVERAQRFRDVLDGDELEKLLATAYLHDVGYAPKLAKTGFHPLDGARFVREAGHERLAALVAHHSASTAEAEERGLADELAEFPAEDSLVARALTYCDLTTGPDGEGVGVSERLEELAERLGEDDPTVRAVRREAVRLGAVVDEMAALLSGRR